MGVTPTKLFDFYETTSQQSGHELGWNFKDNLSTKKHPKLESDITKLLNIGLKISKHILKHKKNKSYLKPNFMLFAILFANEYKQKLNAGSVNWNNYTKKLLEVWDKWDKEVSYRDETYLTFLFIKFLSNHCRDAVSSQDLDYMAQQQQGNDV